MNQYIFIPPLQFYCPYPYTALSTDDVIDEAAAIGIIGADTDRDLAQAFINLYECIQNSRYQLNHLVIHDRSFYKDLGICYLDPEQYIPKSGDRQYRVFLLYKENSQEKKRKIGKSYKKCRIAKKDCELAAFHVGAGKEVLPECEDRKRLPNSTYFSIQIVNASYHIAELSINLDKNSYIKDHTLYIMNRNDTDAPMLLGALDISKPLKMSNPDMRLFLQNIIQYAYETSYT